jgi:hypothetical protein
MSLATFRVEQKVDPISDHGALRVIGTWQDARNSSSPEPLDLNNGLCQNLR